MPRYRAITAAANGTKECDECHAVRPLTDFHRMRDVLDGHGSKCKECKRANTRASYRARRNDPAWVEKERARCREKDRKRRGPSRVFVAPEGPRVLKNHCSTKVQRAVKKGVLAKPDACTRCGRRVELEGHHADYSKPLSVEWLCVKCHRNTHYVPKSEVA